MPHIEDSRPIPQEDPSVVSERTYQIRVKNRRKLYLDRHPSYFTNADLELADPLLYDRCIRRFQTAAEREADGKAKGYSGVLEADLYRSEAKLAALAQSTQPPATISNLSISSSSPSSSSQAKLEPLIPFVSYLRGPNGEIMGEDGEEVKNREQGQERWKFEMTVRFLRGGDEDFDYGDVDESEEFDEVEKREKEERWFDEEEPEWDGEGGEGSGGTGGETGVQDF
ncbi:hypothetical protein N431DRAFT_430820 [Stipitochalara longipes BDJ]|nr:hypothetical protein N431DRAFT_430820 [Stipitochalara longipes BDJ]